jgi:hypothetical protein
MHEHIEADPAALLRNVLRNSLRQGVAQDERLGIG